MAIGTELILSTVDTTIHVPNVHCRWSKSDPVENGWVAGTTVKIYKFSTTLESSDRKIFYRPTVGSCSCK
jgi:hypothetical protein